MSIEHGKIIHNRKIIPFNRCIEIKRMVVDNRRFPHNIKIKKKKNLALQPYGLVNFRISRKKKKPTGI